LSVLIFAVFLPDFIFCTTVAYTFGLQTPITAKRSMRGCWARGENFSGVKILDYPLTLPMGLNTV